MESDRRRMSDDGSGRSCGRIQGMGGDRKSKMERKRGWAMGEGRRIRWDVKNLRMQKAKNRVQEAIATG